MLPLETNHWYTSTVLVCFPKENRPSEVIIKSYIVFEWYKDAEAPAGRVLQEMDACVRTAGLSPIPRAMCNGAFPPPPVSFLTAGSDAGQISCVVGTRIVLVFGSFEIGIVPTYIWYLENEAQV